LLENYLTQLQVSFLLELRPKTKRYATTTKGSEFIETWTRLQEIIIPQKNLAVIKTKNYSANRKRELTIIPVINKKWPEN
jgi:hypothetical protein